MAVVSRKRLKQHLKHLLKAADGWLSSEQLAASYGVSWNTVTEPLKAWVVKGVVERSPDTSIPDPDLWSAGVGNSLWRWRTPPIGRPEPTDRLLCRPCATHEFGDWLRYLGALSKGPQSTILQRACEAERGQSACVRCGRTDLVPLHRY